MDGFTGLNPSQARANIDTFVKAMNDAAVIFLNGGIALFKNLEKTWCSPKAVAFGEKYGYALYDKTVVAIREAATVIAKNAETAYNTISMANGGGVLGAEYGLQELPIATPVNGYFGPLKESGEYGIIGMNLMQVQLALVVYGDSVEKGLAALDSVPTEIAFYDPDGIQQSTYKSEIQRVKDKLEEEISSMLDTIEAAMETEQNNIFIAKESSSSTLKGVL